MFERDFEHIGDDLHIPVRMRWEPRTWIYPVIVDHPQSSKSHMPRIVILVKRECMVAIEPTNLGVAPLFSISNLNHYYLLLTSIRFNNSRCYDYCQVGLTDQVRSSS